MRWVFLIGGIVSAAIAVFIAIHLVDFIQKGEEVKRLNDLIIGK